MSFINILQVLAFGVILYSTFKLKPHSLYLGFKPSGVAYVVSDEFKLARNAAYHILGISILYEKFTILELAIIIAIVNIYNSKGVMDLELWSKTQLVRQYLTIISIRLDHVELFKTLIVGDMNQFDSYFAKCLEYKANKIIAWVVAQPQYEKNVAGSNILYYFIETHNYDKFISLEHDTENNYKKIFQTAIESNNLKVLKFMLESYDLDLHVGTIVELSYGYNSQAAISFLDDYIKENNLLENGRLNMDRSRLYGAFFAGDVQLIEDVVIKYGTTIGYINAMELIKASCHGANNLNLSKVLLHHYKMGYHVSTTKILSILTETYTAEYKNKETIYRKSKLAKLTEPETESFMFNPIEPNYEEELLAPIVAFLEKQSLGNRNGKKYMPYITWLKSEICEYKEFTEKYQDVIAAQKPVKELTEEDKMIDIIYQSKIPVDDESDEAVDILQAECCGITTGHHSACTHI